MAAEIAQQIDAAAGLPHYDGKTLSLASPDPKASLPFLFHHDLSKTVLGQGDPAFSAARQALAGWKMFDLGWVRVANAKAPIAKGELVAVEASTLGLWTLNVSRILEAIDKPGRFGFIYATTELHVEDGEERFLLEMDPDSGAVTYTLQAVSRPRDNFARLGWPITRAFQHRFARDSHRRMQQLTNAAADTLVT